MAIVKIILAPDSFKHTLTATEFCTLSGAVLQREFPEASIVNMPLADGGEGTVDTLLNILGGEKVCCIVRGPLQEPVAAFLGLVSDGYTAVLEMAAAAGLPLVGDKLDPSQTTTYGVGQLVAEAIRYGRRRIILGIGGSATNDAGCGMAAALGVRFFDKDGKCFIPTGANLDQIARIDLSERLAELADCELIAICDITSPLHGPGGAAYLFAPQKGANANMVAELNRQLEAIDKRIQSDLHLEVAHLPGSGAAGGLGAGIVAFLDGELRSGIETLLDLVQFDEQAKDATFIITGEGRIDGLTLEGKVVCGIAQRAKKIGVPVFAVVGDIGENASRLYDLGLTAIMSTNRRALPLEEALKTSREDLVQTVTTLARLLKTQLFF